MAATRTTLSALVPLADLKRHLGITWDQDDAHVSSILEGNLGRLNGLVGVDVLAYDDANAHAPLRLQQTRTCLLHMTWLDWLGAYPRRSVNAPDVASQAIRDLRASLAREKEMQPNA